MQVLKNAVKKKEIRNRMLFTLAMLLAIRACSQVPSPGINSEYYKEWFSAQQSSAIGFLNAFTGGSFERMSILALNITPAITASIVIQLLTFAIPALEEIQKDGEAGRRKIEKYTRYMTLALALLEAAGMAIGFGRSGILTENTFPYIALVTSVLTAGAMATVWLGDVMTKHGIGNGISMILMANILSRVPQDLSSIGELYVKGRPIGIAVTAVLMTCIISFAVIIATVYLNEGERRIPRQNSSKMNGRRMVGAGGSIIPIKANSAGVLPVIFAMSIMQFPGIITQFTGYKGGTWGEVLNGLSSVNWFRFTSGARTSLYSVGYIVYAVLLVFFAYFYNSYQLNPYEISENLKKSGSTIPGIRPGSPTKEYLEKRVHYMTGIGALCLLGIATVPLVIGGIFSLNLSFGGTSLIIIVSVLTETYRQIEGMLATHNYATFI